jgi:large subunit ribosomal protein L21
MGRTARKYNPHCVFSSQQKHPVRSSAMIAHRLTLGNKNRLHRTAQPSKILVSVNKTKECGIVYAVIEDRTRQYKVTEGQMIDIDLLPAGQTTVEFDRVLLVGEGASTKVGEPTVAGAKVVARVATEEVKGPKLDVGLFIRRKGLFNSIGHRQKYTRVVIEKIIA